MKAMLINANEQKITKVDAGDPNKSLERLREFIGCELVQPVVLGGELTLWVDEEGRLKLPKPGFLLKGFGTDFAGNGVLLGGDAGQVKPCLLLPEMVVTGIGWLAPGEVTPPGRTEIHFI